MRVPPIAFTMLAVSALCACQTPVTYYRADASPAQLDADYLQCLRLANAYAASPVPTPPSYNVYGMVGDQPVFGTITPQQNPFATIGQGIAANAQHNAILDNCMVQHGYAVY